MLIGGLASEGSVPGKLPGLMCEIHANREPLANTNSNASGNVL